MIKIENLTFGYHKTQLFDKLQLDLSAGRVYGLLGKNGVGKTSLLKLITGLMKPNSGNITVMNENPFDRNPSLLEEIFFIPDEFDLANLSIKKYAQIYGCFYPHFSQTEFVTFLKEFNVDEKINLTKMSLGQKKKAYISFALACNTKLLIMDEPTNGLDIPSKGSFRRIISSLAGDDRTIIISTHQVRDLEQLIDSLVILDNNEILINATINEITDKLSFKHLEANEEALYSEQTVQGRWGITHNINGQETNLDMELLFNAAVATRKQIKNIMSHDNK